MDVDWLKVPTEVPSGAMPLSKNRILAALDSIPRHRNAIILAIMLFAIGIHMAIAVLAGIPNSPEQHEAGNVGRALAAGRGYANTFGPATGPSANFPPLPPLLLAGIYLIFGLGKTGAIAQLLFGFTQVAVLSALLLPLAETLQLPMLSGCIGAFFMALPNDWGAETGEWDNVLSAILIVSIIIAVERLRSRNQWSLREAMWSGLGVGITLMVTPPLLLWFGMLALIGWINVNRRAFARFLAVSAFTAILVLLPWTIRNQIVLGSPVWSRSNLGLELSLSHRDGAYTEWGDAYNAGVYRRFHPSENEAERLHLMQSGEIAYNREKLHQAVTWATHHPAEEIRLLLGRIFHFWFPTVTHPLHMAWISALTLLGLCGLARWFSRANVALELKGVVGALLLTFPLAYYTVLTEPRYRYPILSLLLLFAGDFITAAGDFVTAKMQRQSLTTRH